MRSSWPARVLLPASQVLAEGSWLAVSYAALQALTGDVAHIGPLELGLIAWAGMAWGRRRRWLTPGAEALGLPMLALLAGALGWLLDPAVRQALIHGDPLLALGLHGPGWVAAIAFWRGEVHRSVEDDDAIQERLLRWAVPGLALPWLAGHLATSGALEEAFTAAAFIGTVLFVASAFTALGLARLEAVRAATGSDWRRNRSWVGLVLGVAIGVTLFSIPAASLLGVPARTLMVAVFGPLQAFFFILLLAATPVVVVAAALADLIGPFMPEGFGLGEIELPDLSVDAREVVSNLPVVIFYVVVALVLAVELVVVGFVLWMRWQERRRMRVPLSDPFEERSIVIPAREETVRPDVARSGGKGRRGTDPTGLYLQALDALERDGRWARRGGETPADHAARVRGAGLELPALGRLAAAYQLMRYAGRDLGERERRRGMPRLRALRLRLRG